MQTVNSYPRIRVFIAFSFCPFLVAPLFAIWAFAAGIITGHGDGKSIFLVFGGSIAFGFAAGISASVFYGIPASAASFIYVIFKPTKNIKSLLLIALTGACFAYAWSQFGSPRIEPLASAVLGAITSSAMALFVLPRRLIKTGA